MLGQARATGVLSVLLWFLTKVLTRANTFLGSQTILCSTLTSQQTLPGHSILHTMDTIAYDQVLTMTTVSVAAFIVEILVFLLLFRHLSSLFWPRITSIAARERIILKTPDSMFGWIKPLFTSEQVILEKCGLDEYLFVRYFNLLLRMFVLITIITVPILPYLNSRGGSGQTGLKAFSILNISTQTQGYCWVHLAAAFIITLYICNETRKEKLNFVHTQRRLHLSPEHRDKPSLTTILITNVPELLRSDFALRQAFQKFPGGIRNISILRDYSMLDKAIHTRDFWLRKLEWAETCLIKDGEIAYRKKNAHISDHQWDLKAKLLAMGRGLWTYNPEDWEGRHDEAASHEGSVIHHCNRSDSGSSSDGSNSTRNSDEDGCSDTESVVVSETHENDYNPDEAQSTDEPRAQVNQQFFEGIDNKIQPFDPGAEPVHPQELWKEHLDELTYGVEIDQPRKNLARLNETILEAKKDTYSRLDAAFVTFNTQQAAIMASNSQLHFGLEEACVELAPEPHDIQWGHLSHQASYHFVLRGCHYLLAALPFIWLPALTAEVLKKYGSIKFSSTVKYAILVVLPSFAQWFSICLWNIVASKRPYISHTKAGLLEFELLFAWSIWWGVLIALVPLGPLDTLTNITDDGTYIVMGIARNIVEAADWYLLLILIAALNITGAYTLNPPGLVLICRGSPSTPRQVWERGRSIPPMIWQQSYVAVQAMALTGMLFSVTAPFVVPLLIPPCALVILSLRYNIIYVNRQRYSTHGAFFLRALQHLFFGLYLFEILLFTLFADSYRFPCGVANYLRFAAIALLALITLAFHIHFHISLHRDLTATNWLDDAAAVAAAEQNPNNLPPSPISPPTTSPSTNPLDATLPGALTLHDLWPEERAALINAVYLHPGAKVPRAVVWLPRDNSGVSDDEILLTEARCERKEEKEDGGEVWRSLVLASNCGAAVGGCGGGGGGTKGGIVVARAAPDWEQIWEVAV